jgi:predicted nucleotidyltransferase
MGGKVEYNSHRSVVRRTFCEGTEIVTLAKHATRWDALDRSLPHLTPDERAGLVAFVDHMLERYGDDLLRVMLFGSKARANFDEESDLDVLVVVRIPHNNHWHLWREITDLTTRLLLETGVNISALVCDEVRYQWWATHRAPIYNSIQRDGIKIWTKRNGP